MRLRLRIERNALPPVQALWPVKDPSCTIAQLFLQINDTFPLEGETWGFEDYAILQDGYELLHYHVVQDALKDDDKLVLKPLKFEDLRCRTMTGRDQISEDGRHLLDGIPFGRPALRAPTRPQVRIPPRKKRKVLHAPELVNGDDGALVPCNYSSMDASDEQDATPGLIDLDDTTVDDSEASDADYIPDAVNEVNGDGDSDEEDSAAHGPDWLGINGEPMKQRQTQQGQQSDASSDDSASGESSELSSDSESDSEDASSDSSDSSSDSDDSWEGLANDEQPASSSKIPEALTNGHSHTKQRSPLKANGIPQSGQDAPTQTKAVTFVGIPNGGSPATQNRNARRRDAKKLKYAKMSGALAQNVTLAQYREMIQSKEQAASVDDLNPVPVVGGAAKVKAASDVDASGDADPITDETAKEVVPSKKRERANKDDLAREKAADIEAKRQQLVNAIRSGGIDVDNNLVDGTADQDAAPEELTSKKHPHGESDAAAAPEMPSPSSTNTRRAKLDLAGSQRLLFGSLGVRVPKTSAERDATQKKLFEGAKRKAVQQEQASEINGTASAAPSAATVFHDAPDSWRDKINLTAVECVEDGVMLSQPPFPFHQRWDPQYNRKGKKRASSTYTEGGGGRKRKRGRDAPQLDEQYDKYNADGYGDALNYDDEEDDEDDEYWEEGALLNGDEADEEEDDDDFPPLPRDLSTLPPLTSPAETKVNDIITFTELAVDESTGWQPQMIARTAKVLSLPATEDKGGDDFRMQLASRDVRRPEYDEEGNRVYSKFEMPMAVEDGDGDVLGDPRVREVRWSELGEVRVVRKAE